MDNKKSNKKEEDLFSLNEDNTKQLNTERNSKKLENNSDIKRKRRLTSKDELVETIDLNTQKGKISKKFYDQFVNVIKKSIKNKSNEKSKDEENNNKFTNIMNKMMDQIIIKNNNLNSEIKTPGSAIKKTYNRQLSYNKDYNNKDYTENLENIKVIQRKFKNFKNKQNVYDDVLNKREKLISINDIKKLNKNELEIILIKYMNKINELYNVIQYYQDKVSVIEIENKKYKESKITIFMK
jgi:hypothetical protein